MSCGRSEFAPDGAEPPLTRLPGGVSSDVYRVDLPSGPVCVKKVLAKLNVSADWRAPVERIHSEAAWFRFAARIVPGRAPTVLAEDPTAHLFVMNYFDPANYPCWKTLLRDGVVDPAFAGRVGETIAHIHRASAGSMAVQNEFATHDFFMALRIEPYLLTAAKAHPDLAERIHEIAHRLDRARIALMHGDLSPKNILVGREGPVILDAETACYGDPAFDLAFCLNHLLLKCVWKPAHLRDYCKSFDLVARDLSFTRRLGRRGGARGARGPVACSTSAGADRRKISRRISDGIPAIATSCARLRAIIWLGPNLRFLESGRTGKCALARADSLNRGGASPRACLWPIASTGSCFTSTFGSSFLVHAANSRQIPSGSKK